MLKIKDPIILQSENTDCEGSWGDWSTCTNDSQNRTYTVTKEPSGTGQPCPSPLTETQFCIDTTATEIGKWPYRIQQNTTFVSDGFPDTTTTKIFTTETTGDGDGATIELHFASDNMYDEKIIKHYQFISPGSGYKMGDEIKVTTGIFQTELGVAPGQDFIIKLERWVYEEEDSNENWWHPWAWIFGLLCVCFACGFIYKKLFATPKPVGQRKDVEEFLQDVGSVLTSISVL